MHRLVATAFVHNPRPDIFTVVDHIDHCKTNNHYTNLRWLSPRLNCIWQKGLCVRLTQSGKWQSKVAGFPTKVCKSKEGAIQRSRELKERKFDKEYFAELKSEPKFRNVGTQCTLIA